MTSNYTSGNATVIVLLDIQFHNCSRLKGLGLARLKNIPTHLSDLEVPLVTDVPVVLVVHVVRGNVRRLAGAPELGHEAGEVGTLLEMPRRLQRRLPVSWKPLENVFVFSN